MHPTHTHTRLGRSKALWLIGTLLAASGCSEAPAPAAPEATTTHEQAAQEEPSDGVTTEQAKLPFIEPTEAAKVFAQQLKAPTALKENVAVHVKLPPPTNPELKDSLVRVIGEPDSPQILFSSDALEKLGRIPKSPGAGFFTTFAQLPSEEIDARVKNEELLASGIFGKPVTETLVLDGRRPIGRTTGIKFNVDDFIIGTPVPLTACPAAPASTLQGWGESLLIRDPAVVQDPTRTWDPCTGLGTQGGKWTFAHFISEMAVNSGLTPQEFVRQWLETWVNNQTINGDVVAARTQMFTQVIQPWATASGISSAMVINPSTGRREVLLGSAGLNLNIAPFRLLAIVNRIDLGRSGPTSGYGGVVTDKPQTAGELRFVFGLTRPANLGGTGGTEATCNLRPFTLILEYGVPGTGCSRVVSWAQQWTQLNTYGGFTSSYRSQLEGMTESVVLANKAPTKGNKNAINQIRTNENTLDTVNGFWELREFTLSTENYLSPPGTLDTPVNGPLRMHTVAQTPNDGAFPFNSLPISNYILSDVLSGVPSSVGPLPNNCSATYSVPFKFGGQDFRGGSALVRPPTHWRAINANGSDPFQVCARFQFSSNTCNGCHFGDSGTSVLPTSNNNNNPPPGVNLGFVHVSPTSGIPAKLSKFLTGGGPGFMFGVNDLQFGSPTWQFADLDARWKRLYDLAHCTSCGRFAVLDPAVLNQFAEVARVVPIDPVIRPDKTPFQIGPVTDLDAVNKLFDVRASFGKDFRDEPVSFIRPAETLVH